MKCTIYMKSGNKVVLRALKGVEFSNRGDDIVALTLTSSWATRFFGQVMIKSIALSQIEAITIKRVFGIW